MTNLLTTDTATFTSSVGTWIENARQPDFVLSHSATDGGVMVIDVNAGTGAALAVASHANGDGVPLSAEQSILVGASVKQVLPTDVARAWQISMNFYDSASAAVLVGGSANAIVSAGSFTAGSYVTISGTITVPATAVKGRLRLRFDGPVTGDLYHVTSAFVDDGQTPTPLEPGNIRADVLTGTGWVLLREDTIRQWLSLAASGFAVNVNA